VRQLGLVSHPVHLHEVRPGVWGFPVRLGPSETPDALEAAASRLVSRLQSQWALPVMGYVGELAPSLDALKDAYLTACETIQYKFAFASRNVLRYDRLADQELRYVEFEPGEYAARLEQLEGGDPESRCAAVDWIFEQIQQKRYAPEAVQNAIARFVFGVIGAIRSLQGDESELRSLEPALQWREAPLTLSGLKERFRAFIEEAADMAAQLRKNNAKGEIVKIKQFIECHYNEDINLKSIAAKFYMNPVYLGQLFRKTYGVYFNDFLLQLRIRNAKRLLRQTELRVYEIARNVGFDNADYFVCKFEKVEGKTPTAYRNELLANT
jgi:two-component system response regulator YesN